MGASSGIAIEHGGGEQKARGSGLLGGDEKLDAQAEERSKKLPKHVDFEDLVSLGQVGLAEAARQCEPGRGVAFTTFAYYRVRCAIFDGLRQMTGVSPALRG